MGQELPKPTVINKEKMPENSSDCSQPELLDQMALAKGNLAIELGVGSVNRIFRFYPDKGFSKLFEHRFFRKFG